MDFIRVRTLHLVEAKLLPPRSHLVRCETNTGVGLEKLLGDGKRTAWLGAGILVLEVDVGVLRLQLLDEGVNVLIFLVFLGVELLLVMDRLLGGIFPLLVLLTRD